MPTDVLYTFVLPFQNAHMNYIHLSYLFRMPTELYTVVLPFQNAHMNYIYLSYLFRMSTDELYTFVLPFQNVHCLERLLYMMVTLV